MGVASEIKQARHGHVEQFPFFQGATPNGRLGRVRIDFDGARVPPNFQFRQMRSASLGSGKIRDSASRARLVECRESPDGAKDNSPGRQPWDSRHNQGKAPEGRQNMAHTFTNLLAHVIFSTKDRKPYLDADLRPDVLAYLGGTVRQLKGKALIVNGTSDHVHLLVSLPPFVSISEVVRILKANSSRWIHESWASRKKFAWQEGYGAFSVSQSNTTSVRKYVEGQEQHHRKVSFQEEFLAFLKKHRIPYDPRYIWA